MTIKRLSLFLLTTGMLTFGAASCDVLDPYEPGTSGSSTGSRQTDSDGARPDSRKISANGQLRKLDLNGSVTWGFETEDGRRFEVIDLPASYHKDGLQVHIEAIVTTYPSQGYGKRISVTEISLLNAPAPWTKAPSGILIR